MTDEWHLNAAWGPRAEAVEACAERLLRFMTAIGEIDPSVARWQRSGDRSGRTIDPGSVVDLLASGVNRTDDPSHRPIPSLGWTLGLFNGLRYNASLMTVTCGATHIELGNSIHWTLPVIGLRNGSYPLDATLPAVEATVTAWEPDWCTIVSFNQLSSQGRRWDEHTFGWIVYLGPTLRARLGPMPPPVTVADYHGGKLVVAAPTADEVTVELMEDVSARINV